MRTQTLAACRTIFHGVLLGLAVAAAPALAHEPESRVALEPAIEGQAAAGRLTIQFQLVDTKTNKVLGDSDLLVEHEKKLHFFIFDPALAVFQHLHPTFNGSVWTIDTELSANGDYWIWAQGQLASDRTEFSGGNRLYVRGGTPANPIPDTLGDHRSGTDGTSRISFDGMAIHAKRMVMWNFELSRTDGTAPQITPYLGELAHFVIVPTDGDSIIHTHPMSTGNPNAAMIHATFPEPGDYRVWVQFNDGGTLRTVALSVTVVE